MTSRSFIEGLSEEQRHAALKTDAPVLIVAGAGSGKTRTLVARFIHLVTPVSEGGLGADAASVMMMTFTNKAAREMRERILPVLEGLRQADSNRHVGEPWIGTFHSLSLRILRAESERAGLNRNFSIYDEADARSLAEEIAESQGRTRFDVDIFFRDLEIAKSRMLGAELLAEKALAIDMKQEFGEPLTPREATWARVLGTFETEDFVMLYGAYQRGLRDQNAVDFSDLLNAVTTLFRQDQRVRDSWRSNFRHFMVDEVQDMNLAQAAWLQAFTDGGRAMLAGAGEGGAPTDLPPTEAHPVNGYRLRQFPRPTVCFVGDDDQSIYAFRGSDVSIMRSLSGRYDGLELRFLKDSYRCQPAILDVANTLVARNSDRFDKTLVPADATRSASQVPVEFFRSSSMEIDRLVIEARKYLSSGRNPGEYAVLLRTRELAKAVAKAFREAGLPVTEGKASDIRKSAEVRDIMAYAGFLVNPEAETFLRRIINKPSRGMGPTSIARVTRNARLKEASFIEELRSVMNDRVDLPEEGEAYGKAFVNSAKAFGRLVVSLRSEVDRAASAGEALTAIMELSGYLPDLKKAALLSAGFVETPEMMALAPREFLSRMMMMRLEASGRSGAEHDREVRDLLEADLEEIVDRGGAMSETARRIGNLSLLLEQAGSFDSLADFLQESTLEMEQADAEAGFRVMTIHASKGLEFDCVRLPFWVEGVMPHSRASDGDAKDLEEERRLAYVALTRAREDLRVSAFRANDLPAVRVKFGRPSPFLAEMAAAQPGHTFSRHIGKPDHPLLAQTGGFEPPPPVRPSRGTPVAGRRHQAPGGRPQGRPDVSSRAALSGATSESDLARKLLAKRRGAMTEDPTPSP